MSVRDQAKEEMCRALECSICLIEFKRPKQLPCLHTFCLECLKKYSDHIDGVQMSCPLCKSEFSLPPGGVEQLSDNDLMTRLILERELLEGKSNHSLCELCVEIDEEIEADSFCLDCRQTLCLKCKMRHRKISQTKQHNIVDINEKPTSDELHRLTASYCKNHSDKKIELYCCDCKILICLICHAVDHNKHACKEVHDIAKQIRDLSKNNQKSIEKCKSDANQRSQIQYKVNQNFLLKVASTENDVRKSVAHVRHVLEQYEKEILERLDTIKKDVQKELESQKDLDEFRSTAEDSFLTYSRMLTERGTDCEIIRAADDLRRRTEELMKDRKKDNKIFYRRQLKFNKASVPSADDVQKLVGTISDRPNADITDWLLSSGCTVKIIPHKKRVAGLTVVDDKIFVVRWHTSQLDAYDLDSLNHSQDIYIPDMISPRGLTGSSNNKALYISDDRPKCIHRIDLTNNSVTSWKMRGNNDPRGLSVTAEHTLLVTIRIDKTDGRCGVEEYTSDGRLVRLIRFDSSIVWAWQTVQLSRNQFVVSHGSGLFQHRICVINTEGQTIKSYGRQQGIGEGQLNAPRSLAIDDISQSIFVADFNNDRVVLLDIDLKYLGQVNVPRELKQPTYICFDSATYRLLVGERGGRVVQGTG